VKEIQSLTEYLGLMVCFDPKTLPRMQPTKAFLQCLNEIVVVCHSTTVVPHKKSWRTGQAQKEQKTSQHRLLEAYVSPLGKCWIERDRKA
jgi:hypothetical protein